MNDDRLISQIIKGFEEGHTRERVKVSLLASGWSAGDIEEGIKTVEAMSPTEIRKPVKVGRYFKILFGIIILSLVIYVVIQLVFQVDVMPIIVSPENVTL